jgi:hypothetical protein
MKFTAWEARKHIERKYYTALKRLVRFLSNLILEGDGPRMIERKLRRLSQFGQLGSWAKRIAHTMVTSTLEENARTWRQAVECTMPSDTSTHVSDRMKTK